MPNIRLKRYTGAAWENVDVQTEWAQILNKPTTFTPTSHTHTKSEITDFAHTHAASDITSGIIATARLGSGTANTTTYLRGDGSWQTVESGGGDPFIYAYMTSDSSKTNSTLTTDLEITSLEADSYYEVWFLGTHYKTSTTSAGLRISFSVDNFTGSPTLFGVFDSSQPSNTNRKIQTVDVITRLCQITSSTATSTGQDINFRGLFYTGTSTQTLRIDTSASTTLTSGAVGLRKGSMLKVRKVN